jgi:hypothetical protein
MAILARVLPWIWLPYTNKLSENYESQAINVARKCTGSRLRNTRDWK